MKFSIFGTKRTVRNTGTFKRRGMNVFFFSKAGDRSAIPCQTANQHRAVGLQIANAFSLC